MSTPYPPSGDQPYGQQYPPSGSYPVDPGQQGYGQGAGYQSGGYTPPGYSYGYQAGYGQQPPKPPVTGRWWFWATLAAVVVVIAGVTVGVLLSSSSGSSPAAAGSNTSAPASTGPSGSSGSTSNTPSDTTSSSSSSSTSQPGVTTSGGDIGKTFTLTGQENGQKLQITLLGVVQNATQGQYDPAPPSGKHYAATELSIKNVGTADYEDSVDNCVTLYEGTTGFHNTILSTISQGKIFDFIDLKPGQSAHGFSAYTVADTASVDALKFIPNSGYASDSATWKF